MKKIFFALILGILFFTCEAQTKDDLQSKAELFSEKTGTLIQKEFIDIATLKKCKIQVVRFTDLITNAEQSALKFEYELASSTSTEVKNTFLDADELDGLMKSIKIIQEKINSKKPTNYTEISFRSRGGFETGCIQNEGVWTIYLILQKFDGERYVWITIADLPILYSFLEQAKDKL
ncbi:MAG: hypothetical protein ACOYLE_05980 [Bacteroidales bacterium]